MLDRLRSALPAMLEDLGALVNCESPSADLAATSRCTDLVATIGTRLLGVAPDRGQVAGHPHLLWRFGDVPSVLLLGHLDTVWPIGALALRPFTIDGGRASGPGCFDMKAGLVLLLHAGWPRCHNARASPS